MITPEDVSYVARLARLRLSEEEQERMTRELSAVLGYVEHMDELELDGVEPTARVVDLVNVLRDDAPRPSLPLESRALERTRRSRRRLRRSGGGELIVARSARI